VDEDEAGVDPWEIGIVRFLAIRLEGIESGEDRVVLLVGQFAFLRFSWRKEEKVTSVGRSDTNQGRDGKGKEQIKVYTQRTSRLITDMYRFSRVESAVSLTWLNLKPCVLR
jgi:hypothetical protein